MIKHFIFSSFKNNNVNTFLKSQLLNKHITPFSTDESSGSSSTKYTSSFKLRSKLAGFFKHIHPDQMNQAPVPF